jgi:hypothetical protein
MVSQFIISLKHEINKNVQVVNLFENESSVPENWEAFA